VQTGMNSAFSATVLRSWTWWIIPHFQNVLTHCCHPYRVPHIPTPHLPYLKWMVSYLNMQIQSACQKSPLENILPFSVTPPAIYILTPKDKVLLNKLTVTQRSATHEIPCLLWNLKVAYRVHNSLPMARTLEPVLTSSHNLLLPLL
jgi:hypothetical protein